MMKRLFAASGRLLLSFVASSVVAFISMMMFLSADVGKVYKVLFGLLFVAFILIIAFSSARNSGEADTKKNSYNKFRGFYAGGIAMIPAIFLAVFYMVISYHGYGGENKTLAEGIYTLLYLIFMAFSPFLSSLVSFNPALSVDIAQPAIVVLNNISMPNAVSAPLFFIPIAMFILASGLGYLAGNKEQLVIKKALKQKKDEILHK